MTQHQPKSSKNKHGLADDIGKPGITPALSTTPDEPLGLKRRHFMGTALALDAAALLAACGGGGGGGDAAAGGGSGSSSGSSSGSVSSSASGSGSGSGSSSGSGSGSGSAAPTNWVVSTLAGTGTSGTATFNTPYGVALDTSGNLYVADANNNRIRKISSSGVVSTLAGTGAANFADGTAATAKFFYPTGVAVDASSNLYVVDQTNHLIRKITPAGVVSTLAGTAWVLGSVDGTGPGASFNYPISIAVDTSGYVYVADTYNHLIRKITPAGVVSTLAGMGGTSGANDGTGLTAKFNRPCGVAADNSGNLYVTDYDNHLIRKISSSGVVSTLAGRAGVSGANDGLVGTATFNNPLGIALDTSGNLYVADYNGHLIRKINNESMVSKIAGSVGISGFIDGTGGTAKFANPTGLAVDAGGHVYVADSNSHSIRKISPI